LAYYLVTAAPVTGTLPSLKQRLESGEILQMQPFGTSLDYSLKHARVREDGTAIWEEEDYCSPPLAAERGAVLDQHFTKLRVEPVTEGRGWQQIADLPSLWEGDRKPVRKGAGQKSRSPHSR